MGRARGERLHGAGRILSCAKNLSFFAALSLYTTVCLLLAQGLWTNEAYRALDTKAPQDEEQGKLPGRRTAASKPLPEQLAGFINVEGTNIDLPVAQPATGQPETWFLSHDLWGNPSPAGCPHLDKRSSPSGEHLLIYGHRMGPNGIFGSVSQAYRQRDFKKLSRAIWTNRDGEPRTYQAAFALHVDKSYGAIQRFRFTGSEDMRSWLLALKEDSSASMPDAEELINQSESVLTLVTCSNPIPGRPERTIVVFIGIGEGATNDE